MYVTDEQTMMELIFCLLIIFAAAFAEGISGIGCAMICMAILPDFFGYYETFMLTKMLGMVFETAVIITGFRNIRWKVMAVPLLASLAASVAGLQLLPVLPERGLKMALGIVLIVFSLWSLFSKKVIKIPATVRNGSVAGVFSGFLGGVMSVPGPPMVIYYLGTLGENKREYFATICATFWFQNIFQFGMQISRRAVGIEIWKLFAYSVTASVAGYILGQKVFRKADISVIRKIIYAIMLVMGIRNLFS